MAPTSIDIPLKGKIILITGGASGIGLSLTKEAHALGARGILVADLRTTPDFDTFATGKNNIIYIQTDVTRWSDFTKIFNICEEKFSDVPDAYGICAGLFEPSFSNFWLDTEEESYKQVEVNVSHPIKLTRLAIRKSLEKGKRASVCIIASIAGLGGSLGAPLYCATKHAVVGFVKSMKDSESMTGVKITTICPGVVHTPLFDEGKQEQFCADMEKVLKPVEVAKQMVELIEKKKYGCGTVLEITTSGTRLIPEWNVEPPKGADAGRGLDSNSDAVRHMREPIEKALEKEKVAKA